MKDKLGTVFYAEILELFEIEKSNQSTVRIGIKFLDKNTFTCKYILDNDTRKNIIKSTIKTLKRINILEYYYIDMKMRDFQKKLYHG